MHRLLIVSPNWAPLNLPDYQRARTSLPYLRECGWDPQVLCLEPGDVPGPLDPELAATIPRWVEITRVRPLARRFARLPGMPSVRYRGVPALARAGDRLLAGGSFDLVFFSTTMFTAMALGPRWKKRFGVPYVADWQDPWYAGRYRHERPRLPGGRLKNGAAMAVARVLEPRVLHEASRVVTVSPSYAEQLSACYSWLRPHDFALIPFGAPEADFALVRERALVQHVFDPGDGLEHWVYAGRVNDEMCPPIRGLLSALAQWLVLDPERAGRVRLHFLGTSYGTGAAATTPLRHWAEAAGVAPLVSELPERIPYLESLACLRDASVVMVLGSADAAYSPSKLYLSVAAGRPLLAIPHDESAVARALERLRGALVVPFRRGDTPEALAARLLAAGVAELPRVRTDADPASLDMHSARAMTQRLCEVFDAAAAAACAPRTTAGVSA